MSHIALFHGARNVIVADERCRAIGIQTKIISTPERYSSECGMCIVLENKDLSLFRQTMEKEHITVTLYEQEHI